MKEVNYTLEKMASYHETFIKIFCVLFKIVIT